MSFISPQELRDFFLKSANLHPTCLALPFPLPLLSPCLVFCGLCSLGVLRGARALLVAHHVVPVLSPLRVAAGRHRTELLLVILDPRRKSA